MQKYRIQFKKQVQILKKAQFRKELGLFWGSSILFNSNRLANVYNFKLFDRFVKATPGDALW